MIVAPEGLTPREVAAALRVHHATVRKWIRRGDLRAYRIGGRLRVAHDELRRFVEAGTPEGSTAA